ncbi:unnamed protein product [Rotaria sp. Silwood1]|nr:unnamed protein product [Rotaria sp. Silwood1]
MSANGQSNEVDKSSDKLYLDKPSTEKELFSDQSFAFGTMQGWRSSNEDFHKHKIPLDENLAKNWAIFSIFDGHNDTNLRELIKDHIGSVCIATLISPEKIFFINLGDSRGIIISNDGKVLLSTKDHKPNVQKEKERIRRAGGRITRVGNDILRVESQLAMTRALGDYSLDKNIVTAIPDLIQYERDSSAEYIIIASDGIWDVMSNEQVASFVSQRISNTTLENIISQLFDQCLKQESSDNMTAYIIKIN